MCVAYQYQYENLMIEIEIEHWVMRITFYIYMGNFESYSEPSQISET